jgi:GR25 family glycosyltransferase involved in LPS biosynthesis
MKFYITHYTPLTERKKKILEQLNKFKITNYEFIETYDKEILTENDIKKFKDIKTTEISLFLKHVEIFKKEDNDIVIVLEDDAIFAEDFLNKLDNYINELINYEWDILFCADCCNLHEKVISNKIFYNTKYSRGTCMYILNKNVSSKINNIYNLEEKIDKAIDLWFNMINDKYKLKYLWSEPTLVKQGSEMGIYRSSIR